MAAIATFKGAFHGFHYIVDMAGRQSIVAAVDEGELPGLYGTGKPLNGSPGPQIAGGRSAIVRKPGLLATRTNPSARALLAR